MTNFAIPEAKKIRVIINTDAKNEVDDQYAIVHGLLTESFDLRGIIAAHFGTEKSPHSEEDSYNEIQLLYSLMKLQNTPRTVHGAVKAMEDAQTPVDSEGARLIIEEAMKEDDRPLYIAFLGPLTDMASALLLEPKIAQKNIKVIWIGGGVWPCGDREYNLHNDIPSANCVFRSSVEVWQVPRPVYRMMPVSFTELYEKVYPCGEIGQYLCQNVIDHNNRKLAQPAEYRVLGDSPAIGLMLYSECGEWEWRPAPEFDEQMHYIHTGKNRPIRVYKNIDSRFILEDFFAKLNQFAKEN